MKFEYKVVAFVLKRGFWSVNNPFSSEEIEGKLNALGQLGWELVSVDSVTGATNQSTREVVAYLKRSLSR